MKNKTLIIGGAAVVAGYFLFLKDKKAPVAKKKTLTELAISRGEQILRDAAQLEGYFPTGATPCCSNCAHGLRCAG